VIHIVLTQRYAYTISEYLASSAAVRAGAVQALAYEDLFRRSELPWGTYVLTDFDRLSAPRLRQVEALAGALAQAGARVLNRPARWLSRLELLRRLYAEGVNPFRAFRLGEVPDDVRYPVFLRLENDHRGVRSGLLHSREEVDAAARGLRKRHRRKGPLLVEFSDTKDGEGRYRKFGAFRIGDRIIPRHVFFGREWMLKVPMLHGAEELEEEWAVVQANPHEDQLRAVFDLAGVEYGRIDYTVVDDRIRVWEINTNPMIATPEDLAEGVRARTAALFAERLAAAWKAIETPEAERAIRLPRMRTPLGERLRGLGLGRRRT
jgi:hypothetical protein